MTVFLGALTVFLLNIAASTMGVTNTLLISKKIMKPVYFIMFIDSIVFTTGMKMVSNSKSFIFMIAFALGKVLGAYCASKIEDKIALGILEVSVYAKEEDFSKIADTLREMGYGVTTMKGYGLNGVPRFSIDVTIQRKELKLLKGILHKFDYSEATMVIREVKSVEGKIKTTHNKEMKIN